ncbi:unnamed protein product [Closterium sp. NIES-54]
MASLRVLAFDHEGCPIQFDTWLDDLQLYLLSDSRDSVSLFDYTFGASPAPPATADNETRSQWLTRDAAVRLAIRNHLLLAGCAHFGQHWTTQALYDAIVARYSSPATAALGRLLMPYLFPELSAFATVEDLVSQLRTSDARYRAAIPAEFLDQNQPPMFITLYFKVTRIPDSLRSVRDHFLALDPIVLTVDLLEQNLLAGKTSVVAVGDARGTPRTPFFEGDHFLSLDPTVLTVDLLEQHLLAAETSVVALGAARGTPRTPFFEGCSPSPLAPSYASATAVDVLGAEDVRAASASGKRRSSTGKGGRGGGGGSGGGGGGSTGGGGGSGGGGGGGSGGGSRGSGGGGGGSSGDGGSGGSGSGGGRAGTSRWGGSSDGQRQQQQRRSETPSPQQLREWFAQCRASGGSGSCSYVIRTELLRSGVAIFDLAYDAILAAMYALSVSAEGDCYRCVPPDPCIKAAALSVSESALPGTAPAEALHAFTLDSGASHCFFRDSTIPTPLSAPVPVRLADPSGGLVLARSSTVLPCPAVPSGSLSGLHLPSFSTNLVSTTTLQDAMVTTTTPGGQRVSICTCTRTGPHLAMFTCRPGLRLYTLATEPPQVDASAQVSASGQVAPPCSCHLLSHQTLLWHHRLGHPSLPRLHGMHSRHLVSGLLRSVPPLPPSPAPLCLPCVEGRHGGRSYLHDPCGCPPFSVTVWVWYAAHQLNLWPRVSLLETSPTLRWIGKVGDASVLQVWGSRAFVRDTSTDKLSARAIPCVFLGFPPNALGWQFYHPTSCSVIPSQDVTFDESVPIYCPFPYRSAPPPAQPLFHAPGPPPVDPLPPQGPIPSSVSHVDPLPGTVPVEVAGDSGAAQGVATGGAACGGADSGGAEPGGAESEGAGSGGAELGGDEPEGVEPGGAESEGVESEGAEPQGTVSSGAPAGASPGLSPRPKHLSPQQLQEWFAQRTSLRSGAAGAGDSAAGDTGAYEETGMSELRKWAGYK